MKVYVVFQTTGCADEHIVSVHHSQSLAEKVADEIDAELGYHDTRVEEWIVRD